MKKEMVWKLIVFVFAAAVGAFLVREGFDIYDRMTESAEECALKAGVIRKETNEKAEELLAQINWSRDVLQRLQKSDSYFQSKDLIYALHKDYGISDSTTVLDNGYVPALSAIKETVEKINGQKLVECKKLLDRSTLLTARAFYMKIRGREWFTTEHGAGKEFDRLRQTLSTEEIVQMVEKMKKESGCTTL